MTFSIVARDVGARQVGAAVQSAWFSSAGAVLVEAGIGAVVSQAMGERSSAHRGLELLGEGATASAAVATLVADDAKAELSQYGLVDLGSAPAAHTGERCVPHAGHALSEDCAAQANMMERDGVPEAMVAAFDSSAGDLAARLLAALDAAQSLGGDFRGMQSAALVVRTGDRDTPADSATVLDVRVDDHPEPLRELRRLVDLTSAYRSINRPLELLARGDHGGALDLARSLSRASPSDPNVRMRLALVLLAVGDGEGEAILGGLAAGNEAWLTYARRSLERFGIDPEPLLDRGT